MTSGRAPVALARSTRGTSWSSPSATTRTLMPVARVSAATLAIVARTRSGWFSPIQTVTLLLRALLVAGPVVAAAAARRSASASRGGEEHAASSSHRRHSLRSGHRPGR